MDFPQEFLKEITEKAQEAAKVARRRALRILIPAVVVVGLGLIGLGILIGKYLL